MQTTIKKITTAVVLSLGLSSCQPDNSQVNSSRQTFLDRRATALESFQPCTRSSNTPQADLVAESLCLDFTVPENYDAPEGRQIALRVMVIPSLSELPESDPLFLLAGGPGQAATDLTGVALIFSRIRTERDIVLVDQRGTGELSPFDCQMDEEEAKAFEEQDPDEEEILAAQLAVLHDCLDTMDADPAFYTTDIAMRDLDRVRETIGYSRLNLWGASYGSRAALAYLQAYPENTRTVIIDAIAPPALTLPLYVERDASASLEKVFEDCAVDTACMAAYPDLEQHYRELIARLSVPQAVTYTDYTDFSTVETTIGDYEFSGFLRQVLYSREAQRLVPLIIEQAWQGNFQPLTALASQYEEAQINQGMFLSVICSEDYSRIDQDQREGQQGNNFLLQTEMFSRFIFEACEFWPKRVVPETYFEPVQEENPVLIFSGTVDPITPPAWGELVHDSLPNSLHLVLEGFGHGTLASSCTAGIMNDFIDSGTLEGLDTDCIGQFRRRPFFVTPGGSSQPDD